MNMFFLNIKSPENAKHCIQQLAKEKMENSSQTNLHYEWALSIKCSASGQTRLNDYPELELSILI